jgi:hypothetical protein
MSARKDVHRIAISQAARTENKGLDGSYRRDAEAQRKRSRKNDLKGEAGSSSLR